MTKYFGHSLFVINGEGASANSAHKYRGSQIRDPSDKGVIYSRACVIRGSRFDTLSYRGIIDS